MDDGSGWNLELSILITSLIKSLWCICFLDFIILTITESINWPLSSITLCTASLLDDSISYLGMNPGTLILYCLFVKLGLSFITIFSLNYLKLPLSYPPAPPPWLLAAAIVLPDPPVGASYFSKIFRWRSGWINALRSCIETFINAAI